MSYFMVAGKEEPVEEMYTGGDNITNWTCSSSVDPDPLKKALVLERNTLNCPVEIITLYFIHVLVPSCLASFFFFLNYSIKGAPAHT